MNLYIKEFAHFAPKDREDGFKQYFLAEDNEDAYSKVYRYDPMSVERAVEYMEEDESEDEVRESAIEEIIEYRGEVNMDDIELGDFYYGVTLNGWKLIKEDISDSEIKALKDLNILKG